MLELGLTVTPAAALLRSYSIAEPDSSLYDPKTPTLTLAPGPDSEADRLRTVVQGSTAGRDTV